MVICRHTTPCLYIIKIDGEKIVRRNQQHLRPTSEDLALLNSDYIDDDDDVADNSSNQQHSNNEDPSNQASQPGGNVETTSETHSRYGRVIRPPLK